MPKRLSVIIVTYNSEADIYDCLQSVYDHNDLGNDALEVIVVDNASTHADAMFAQIRQRFGDAPVLIPNDRNGGYGQGNNVGIRQASAPVIMIMNPDVRLCEPVFQTALRAFEHSPSLCLYGMKQMYTVTTKSRNSFACTTRMNGYAWVLLTAIANRINLYVPRLMYLQGSCFFLRKSSFEAVGLFDESIFMYGEEEDIHFRLSQQFGPQFAFNPQLHYLHLAQNRRPSLDYEIRLADRCVEQNQKRGWSPRKTLRNLLRSKRLLLLIENMRHLLGKPATRRDLLLQLRAYLQSRIQQTA